MKLGLIPSTKNDLCQAIYKIGICFKTVPSGQNVQTSHAFPHHKHFISTAVDYCRGMYVSKAPVNHDVHYFAVLPVDDLRVGKIFENVIAVVVQGGGNDGIAQSFNYCFANLIIRHTNTNGFFVLL